MLFALLFLQVCTINAAFDTLNASSGTGTGNEWNTGGENVGSDCAKIGGTSSVCTKQNRTLSVPIIDELDTLGTKGKISQVFVYCYAKANVSLIGLKDGISLQVTVGKSTSQDINYYELTSSHLYYSAAFPKNPSTFERWQWSGVNGISAGCESIVNNPKDFSYLDVDHVFIVVQYDAIPLLKTTSSDTSFSSSDCFQRTDGSGIVQIDYRLYDRDNSTVEISVQYWNNSLWQPIPIQYIQGDIGKVNAQSQITNRQILWNAAAHLGSIEVNNYNVRIVATDDSLENDSISFVTNSLRIDTKAPRNFSCKYPENAGTPGGPAITLESYKATDLSTIQYWFDIDNNATLPNPISSSWLPAGMYQWLVNDLVLGQTYYWRVKTKDYYGNSASYVDTFHFTLSNNKPSVIIKSVSASTNGSGLQTITYDLTDPQMPEQSSLRIEHSIDNGNTWRQSFIRSTSNGDTNNLGVSTGTSTGQIRGIQTNVTNATCVWDTKKSDNQSGSLDNIELQNAILRIIPTDASSNTGSPSVSYDFTVDNKAPTGYGCYLPANSDNSTSIMPTLTSSKATDLLSIRYYFELDDDGTFTTPLQNSGWVSDSLWSISTLESNTIYYWRVKTIDAYGNVGTYGTPFSFKTTNAVWIYPKTGTIGSCSSPCLGDGVVYVGTGGTDNKVYCIDILTGSMKWSYQVINSPGNKNSSVNNICLYYDEVVKKYAIYFTTQDGYIYGIWDNGTFASNRFTPVNIGNRPISEPIVSIDGKYLYLSYGNRGRKYVINDMQMIWQTDNIKASTTSASVIDNDFVYFGSDVATYKYNIDNTAQGIVECGATTPLGLWYGILFVTRATNYAYAINTSNMTLRWTSPDLGATTGTAVFCGGNNTAYVGAGSTLKALNSSTGAVLQTYVATNTINSLPIKTSDGRSILFGCNDSKAYGITPDFQTIEGWPKSVGGAIQSAPAIDMVNNMVVFASVEGKIYAFTLP